jgi:hypothetical protein
MKQKVIQTSFSRCFVGSTKLSGDMAKCHHIHDFLVCRVQERTRLHSKIGVEN